MKITTSGKFPEWIDIFAKSWGKKLEENDNIKEAEINIKDLPKVSWKEDIFYVQFNDKGANLLNSFGNKFLDIPNVATVEEVDNYLNNKEVVVGSGSFDEELEKISAYLEDEEEVVEKTAGDEFTPSNDEFSQQNTQTTDTQTTDNEQDKSDDEVDDIEKSLDESKAQLNFTKVLAGMQMTIDSLKRKIESLTKMALSNQNYSYTDPGDVYDIDVTEEDQKHMRETEEATRKQIEIEHSLDLTQPKNKNKLLYLLDEDNENIQSDQTNIVEEKPEEQITNEINIDENQQEENVDNKESIENEDEIDIIDDNEEENKGLELLIPIVEDNENNENDTKDEDIVEEIEIDNDEQPKKLSAVQSNIFKNQVCPICGNNKLSKFASVKNFVGVNCHSCGVEYAVNTTTEEIYRK